MRLDDNDATCEIVRIALEVGGAPTDDIIHSNADDFIWDCSLKRIKGGNDISNSMEFAIM